MDPKMFKVCRLCMLQEKSIPFEPFFEPGLGKYGKWPKYVRWTLNLEIEEVKGIPILICARCRQTLEEYVKYRDTVLKCNERFNALVECQRNPIFMQEEAEEGNELIEVDYENDDVKNEEMEGEVEMLYDEEEDEDPQQYVQTSIERAQKRKADEDFSYFSEGSSSPSKSEVKIVKNPVRKPAKIEIKSEEIIKPAVTAKPIVTVRPPRKSLVIRKPVKAEDPPAAESSRKEPHIKIIDPDLELYLQSKKPPPPMSKPLPTPPNAKKSRKETHKLYDCPDCDEKFCNDYERQDHWRNKHTNRKIRKRDKKRPTPKGTTEVTDHPCSYCDLYFHNKFDMLLHRKRTHEQEESTLRCPHCHKFFKTLTLLRSHIKTSHALKSFQCSDCGQCFAKRCSLELHIKREKGLKDFICDICASGFVTKDQLVMHMTSHSDHRSFTCDVENCGVKFKRKHSLRKHIRVVHLKLKPHVCEICGRRFSIANHLKGHMSRVHQIVDRPKPK